MIELVVKKNDLSLVAPMGEGYAKGYKEGSSKAYDDFWDNYQRNGDRRNYQYAFAGVGWTDETFKPKYPIIADKVGGDLTEGSHIFYDSDITEIKTPITINNVSASSFFTRNGVLRWVEEITFNNVPSFSTFANGCGNLEHIIVKGTISFNFAINGSPKLDSESVQSILNALDTLPEGTTRTVTFHNTVGKKLTQPQIDAANAKGWKVAF